MDNSSNFDEEASIAFMDALTASDEAHRQVMQKIAKVRDEIDTQTKNELQDK